MPAASCSISIAALAEHVQGQRRALCSVLGVAREQFESAALGGLLLKAVPGRSSAFEPFAGLQVVVATATLHVARKCEAYQLQLIGDLFAHAGSAIESVLRSKERFHVRLILVASCLCFSRA